MSHIQIVVTMTIDMAAASIDAISNRLYDLEFTPVEIRDTERPLYIQYELVRDKRLWPLVEKLAEFWSSIRGIDLLS